MRIDVLSLFPGIAQGALGESILGRAQERELINVRHWNLRDFATGKHRTTDDTPYGGGQGMVMKCEPIFAAVEAIVADAAGGRSDLSANPEQGCDDSRPTAEKASTLRPFRIVVLSPAGRVFTQTVARDYAALPHLILIAGHYEGVDQRVIDHLAHEELSIGDYVLTNGALAAAVVVDAVARLLPGVLGHENSASDDSFANGLLEFPHYTRPLEFRGWGVPEILLSGHHAAIFEWRRAQALQKTRACRPELLGDNPASAFRGT